MFSKVKYGREKLNYMMCYTASSSIIPNLSWEKFMKLPHNKKLNLYLSSSKHLEEVKSYTPKKYLLLKRFGLPNLYLIDSMIAKDMAKHILPSVQNTNQLICETNAGLGFLTTELLEGGVKWIRLYETCPDFRLTLKSFSDVYPGRVELFVKDIFHIWRLSYMDKMDKGDRIIQLLKGVPQRNWFENPVMTIIGTMPKLDFLSYLFKMICFQSEIAACGRIQLFVIMRPGDYLRLTAGPEYGLHTYQVSSVFANVFCKINLIEKYPRIAFLPWEAPPGGSLPRAYKKHDIDKLYLVHIQFKKEYPMKIEHLLPFYYFTKQLFGKGTLQLIPKLEKWISGSGQYLLLDEKDRNIHKDLDIFTKCGELAPMEILHIFKIFYDIPGYSSSSFAAIIDAELLKYETRDSDPFGKKSYRAYNKNV